MFSWEIELSIFNADPTSLSGAGQRSLTTLLAEYNYPGVAIAMPMRYHLLATLISAPAQYHVGTISRAITVRAPDFTPPSGAATRRVTLRFDVTFEQVEGQEELLVTAIINELWDVLGDGVVLDSFNVYSGKTSVFCIYTYIHVYRIQDYNPITAV